MVPKEVGEEWLAAANRWTKDTTDQYHAVRERLVSGKQCEYCGAPARTFDHIVTRSRGGPDTWENLAYTCSSCNNSKGSKSLLEWIDHCNRMLRSAVRHGTDRDIWLRRLHGITGVVLKGEQ